MLTVDEEGYPKGRAFTSKIIYDGKLYIITGNAKRVYKQIVSNPKVEILAYQMKNQEYMRVDATAVISEDTVIKEAYLEKEPQVRGDFEGDAVPQMGLFFLKDASVEITARKKGKATVTATTADGGFTASCAVTVTE